MDLDRAFKISMMVGVIGTTISLLAIYGMLRPYGASPPSGPEASLLATTDVRWTSDPVRVPEPRQATIPAAATPAPTPQSAAVAPPAAAPTPPASPVPASAPPAEASAPPVVAAPVVAPSVQRPPAAETRPPDGPSFVLRRPRVVDGGSFRADGVTIRLANIEALRYRERCDDDRGRVWRCGAEAAAMLRAIASRGPLECTEVGVERRALLAECRIEGQDVGRLLAARGLAIPRVGTQAMNEVNDAR